MSLPPELPGNSPPPDSFPAIRDAIAFVLGLVTGAVGSWLAVLRHRREETTALFDSYDRDIAILQSQFDRENDTERREERRTRLEELENEKLSQGEAYRASRRLQSIVGTAAIAGVPSFDFVVTRTELIALVEDVEELDAVWSDADDHLARGLAYLSLGRNEDALGSFQEAANLDPSNPAAWNNKSFALVQLRRYAEALAPIEVALGLVPDNPLYLANLSHVLATLGRYEQGLAAADKALAISPDLPAALTHRSNNLRMLGRIGDALLAAERSIALDAAQPGAWHGLSAALREIGRIEEAVDALNRELELGPFDLVHSLTDKGLLLRRLGRIDEARSALDDACALSAHDPQPFLARASLKLQAGDPEGAFEDNVRASLLVPDDVDAILHVAEAHFLAGRAEQSLAVLRTVRTTSSALQSRSKNLQGRALRALGDDAAALEAWREAEALDEANPWPLVNMAEQLESEPEQALEFLHRAAAIRPGEPGIQSHLGYLLLKEGRLAEARSPLQRTLELNASDWAALANLAVLEVRAGEYEEALARLEELFARHPAMRGQIRTDDDFDALKANPTYAARFEDLVGDSD